MPETSESAGSPQQERPSGSERPRPLRVLLAGGGTAGHVNPLLALASGGLAVYIIGRTVVLRRRTVAGGWPPLWVWIGTVVFAVIVAITWTMTIVAQMLGSLPIGLTA